MENDIEIGMETGIFQRFIGLMIKILHDLSIL